MRALYIVASVLMLLGWSEVSGRSVSFDCKLSRLQPCLKLIFSSMRNLGSAIPTTVAEMDKKCDGMKEGRSCFSNYMSKCAPPSMRLVATFVDHFRNKTSYIESCKPGSAFRKEYLKHGACIRKGAMSEDVRNALREAILVKYFDATGFQSFCCAFSTVYRTFINIVRRQCGDIGHRYLKAIWDKEEFLVIMSSACEHTDPESETCKTLLPPPGTKFPEYGSMTELQFLFAILFNL